MGLLDLLLQNQSNLDINPVPPQGNGPVGTPTGEFNTGATPFQQVWNSNNTYLIYGPRDPATKSALDYRRSIFTGAVQDTWEPLTNLGLSTCNCTFDTTIGAPLYSGCYACNPEPFYDGYMPYNPSFNGGVPACSDLFVS